MSNSYIFVKSRERTNERKVPVSTASPSLPPTHQSRIAPGAEVCPAHCATTQSVLRPTSKAQNWGPQRKFPYCLTPAQLEILRRWIALNISQGGVLDTIQNAKNSNTHNTLLQHLERPDVSNCLSYLFQDKTMVIFKCSLYETCCILHKTNMTLNKKLYSPRQPCMFNMYFNVLIGQIKHGHE